MLKKCFNPECDPREQIRGEMGSGDYKDVELNNGPDFKFPGVPHKTVEHYKFVELRDDNRNDFRICCMTCGKASSWGPRDVPGMPGAGADWIVKRWNETQ